jgi:hypothetical protein
VGGAVGRRYAASGSMRDTGPLAGEVGVAIVMG